MSVLMLGGNESMEKMYINICKEYGHKAKIYTKENGKITKKIGNPDLIIFFTNTISHKMLISGSKCAKKNNIEIQKTHTSSAFALHNILKNYGDII